MEGGGAGDDVALSRNLTGETEDRAGDLVDFGEADDAWEGGVGVVGDGGVHDEDAHGGAVGGGDVAVEFFEEDHGCGVAGVGYGGVWKVGGYKKVWRSSGAGWKSFRVLSSSEGRDAAAPRSDGGVPDAKMTLHSRDIRDADP